jgi:hypothetical protein
MRPAFVQSFDASFDDVRWCIEIGLADFKMHNVFALGFQSASAGQDLKGGLGAQAGHASRQAKLSLRRSAHGKTVIINRRSGESVLRRLAPAFMVE